MIKNTAVLLIKCYQKAISPLLGSNCRYNPTCSQYTLEAIQNKGTLKGIYLGVKRLLTCHPFHKEKL